MSNPAVSIIIPVYNVELYLDACFESILCQTYSDYEVIIIDDGSTDSSGKICDSYAEKDSRFIVVHQQNKGIGNSRNLAMDMMKGEFCFFLDPDDLFAKNDTLQYMIDLITINNADMVLGVSANFRDEKEIINPDRTPVEVVYTKHQEILDKVLFDKRDIKPYGEKKIPSIVNYEFFSTLYRTSLFEENNIRFLDISYGEDTYLCFHSLICAKAVVTTDIPTYWHRRNPTSTSFQYHDNYISETEKYYKAYLSLFEKYEPTYVDRAKIGIQGQCCLRTISAIDREILLAPALKNYKAIYNTFKQIANSDFFKSLYPEAKQDITSSHVKRVAEWLYNRHLTMATLFVKSFYLLRKITNRK